MAVAGMVDANGKFTAEYAAYTKLTLVNRFVKKQIWGKSITDHKSMSFTDFLEAMKKTDIINEGYARPVDAYEIRNRAVNEKRNNNHYFEMQKFHAIQKAYELGLVDIDGILLSKKDATK